MLEFLPGKIVPRSVEHKCIFAQRHREKGDSVRSLRNLIGRFPLLRAKLQPHVSPCLSEYLRGVVSKLGKVAMYRRQPIK